MDQVRRKRIRLPASNYEAGWYFVTICTDHRTNFLANVTPTVGADDSVRPCVALEGYTSRLTPIGLAVRECLERLTDAVHGVVVDKYIIMPNHVHAIICLSAGTGGQSRPPLQGVIQRFKSVSTRQGWKHGVKKLWQRSFFDHVIRCEEEYRRIWQYIDDNPAKWAEYEYYSAE